MKEIICYDVIRIDKEGITLDNNSTNIRVLFEDCAQNYANENSLITSKCVATRDISTLTFSFYTVPKTKIIFKRHLIKDLFFCKSPVNKFFDLQNAISQFGYTSYDLS